ncbi:hypothetical protein PIB30_069956 [Stylosanthes scabra]|uniref:Uncharacterized protein n=1 Tax=Stylosanthes scabra TaxID=79078 RepID=A0ABU6QND8_9FABA|nr:hypothetical protein [Stylosanthes scabra]
MVKLKNFEQNWKLRMRWKIRDPYLTSGIESMRTERASRSRKRRVKRSSGVKVMAAGSEFRPRNSNSVITQFASENVHSHNHFVKD